MATASRSSGRELLEAPGETGADEDCMPFGETFKASGRLGLLLEIISSWCLLASVLSSFPSGNACFTANGSSGIPTGEAMMSLLTCSGYLTVYLNDRYPPSECPGT